MAEHFIPPDLWWPFGAFPMGVVQGAGRIARLYHPDLLIEIAAVAKIPLERFIGECQVDKCTHAEHMTNRQFSYRGYRFRSRIISLAVWFYPCFCPSFSEVEYLLAENRDAFGHLSYDNSNST